MKPLQLKYHEETTNLCVQCGCGQQFYEYGKDAFKNLQKWRETHTCSLREPKPTGASA